MLTIKKSMLSCSFFLGPICFEKIFLRIKDTENCNYESTQKYMNTFTGDTKRFSPKKITLEYFFRLHEFFEYIGLDHNK